MIALVYLTCGIVLSFFLTKSVSGIDPTTSAGYATTMLWNILWSFIGLLLLPTLSRRSTLYVDQSVVNRRKKYLNIGANELIPGLSQDSDNASILESALKKIERLSDDEPKRSKWLERIFHPIPSRASRNIETIGFS
ncbi:MAG: hypothetical protein AB8G05_00825 [Oligoflexales bacterium]